MNDDATTAPAACPRCRSAHTGTVAVSPVPGCWTVRACTSCHYCWRSTEPREATDPAHYPIAFRIDTAAIPAMPEVPPLPLRRTT